MKTVRLALALHNHQPVGNLDFVVERAMEDAYLPFLSVMEEFPQIPFTLHISGCLFEWAEHNAPEYLDRVGSLVKSGTVEILGGGRAEPIFTMLPERDVTGQIRSFTAQLEKRFGVRPEGAWLPERVWEQHLTGLFEGAGVRYTVVDDFHMKRAGVTGPDLYNVFLTEDRGSVLRLFPSCETLRYTIPFRKPEETLDFLRSVASETEDRLVVYADDGEKFGTWPGTKKHVYEDGWLARFFDLLSENTDWIRLTTLGEACRELERPTRIYLPDSSYREMLEWALPSRRLAEFRGVENALEHSNLLDAVRPFLGGGFWRNFKVKYSEALNLYARMMEVSEAVAGLPEGDAAEEARLELYRGQCNCVHWHGVFGGLYLPHLRFAAYKHLLGAERICRDIPGSAPPPSHRGPRLRLRRPARGRPRRRPSQGLCPASRGRPPLRARPPRRRVQRLRLHDPPLRRLPRGRGRPRGRREIADDSRQAAHQGQGREGGARLRRLQQGIGRGSLFRARHRPRGHR